MSRLNELPQGLQWGCPSRYLDPDDITADLVGDGVLFELDCVGYFAYVRDLGIQSDG